MVCSSSGLNYVNASGVNGNRLTNLPSGNYGCGGACNSSQSGGYRFKKLRSKRSRSRRHARGTKHKTRRSTKARKGGKKCCKTRARARGNKKKRTRARARGNKKKRTRRRMLGGSMTGLSPSTVGENISLPTSYENSDVPSSFGYSVAGKADTLSGALANPPPHSIYQQCPGA